MNNFRHHHPKPFGGRGTDMINPWMTEEELLNMRRQNPQFNSAMQNMPQSMHPAFLNQSNMLPNPNKNFANQNSCKMPGSNFSRSPNMDVFKSPYMNEPNYSNRFVNNRFPPNNAFTPHMNMQHKMNDGPSFKDFPSANMMPSQQSNKNDGFSESIAKPLFANTRQPQERFSCMQDDQVQFHSKYDNLKVFQEKGFPFSSDKDFPSQNLTSMNDPMSVASNMSSYKPNYKAPSLFPAYTPKDVQDDSSKNVQQSAYNSPFMEKSNTFCDKTVLPPAFAGKSDNFCDKVSTASATYSKTIESFQGKSEPFQERNTVERVANDLFSSQGATSSFMYDKQPLKTMPTSHDSLKTLDSPAPSQNMKYSYPPENQQQSCYQSDIQNYPSSTSSKDCLMQSAPFSTQSDVQQNVKETFSSFNFESSINTTDIADLLPGLDAFLKEHLSDKSEEVPTKNDVSKSSASNCAFSDDEWSKHSIPFIGDNQTPGESNTLNSNKDPVYDDPGYVKEKSGDKSELKPEKATDLQLSVVNQPKNSPVGDNLPKTTTPEKETQKSRSVLEEAIELLVNNDAIVGLDYIIEYKKNIAHAGSIPFRCKLCNSAITRPSIIDHILGSKHRMRYLKTKDESKYDYIVSLKIEKSEKDAKIAEASFELEKIYGRGCVTVDMVEYQKDSCADNSKDTEYGTEEPVFTLDKIPIGFEALSPQHEEMNTDFTLHSNHDDTDQVASHIKKETSNAISIEEKRNAPSKDVSLNSTVVLPGLESGSSVHDTKSDVKSVSPHLNLDNEISKASNVSKDSDTKVPLQLSDSGLTAPTKRASSSEDTSLAKHQKIDSNNESIKKEPDVKSEDSVVDLKKFIFADLEKLSKSPISSEEEASVALQVINVLMEMLLRYKLQHVSLELVEKLMKSLHTKSPETSIEELSSLLKGRKSFESLKLETTASIVRDAIDNIQLKPNISQDVNTGKQVKPELSGSHNLGVDLPVKTLSSNPSLSNKVSSPVSDTVVNNTSISAPQDSGPAATIDNAAEVSKNASDVSVKPQASKSQSSNTAGLKPPPFFSWPQQSSEGISNQVSYAAVQGSQSMIWTSPYQPTQAQYSQMPYYQQQNYGGAFSGTRAFQTQFPLLQHSSVPMEMAQPPLPPPPPPPPPAPGPANPPLPPMPNSSLLYPSPGNSVPLPSNPLPCVTMYSNKHPPLPPPLP